MVKDAYLFLLPLLLAASLCVVWGWWGVGLPLFGLALFVAYFFRNPERVIPDDPRAIVSPADGKIVKLQTSEAGTLVCIFLSIFDVHVNRAPIGGIIQRQQYRAGKFHFAWDERASLENEQLRMRIVGDHSLDFSLIAGLVARRIVPWTELHQQVERGDRIALIRFGSRVDILLPPHCRLQVAVGDRVWGGSSILARWE